MDRGWAPTPYREMSCAAKAGGFPVPPNASGNRGSVLRPETAGRAVCEAAMGPEWGFCEGGEVPMGEAEPGASPSGVLGARPKPLEGLHHSTAKAVGYIGFIGAVVRLSLGATGQTQHCRF
jgi:hypothetical protein